jgi:hypothetical protein
LDLVVEDIGEGDEATLTSIDGPEILETAPKHGDEIVVVVVWVFIE